MNSNDNSYEKKVCDEIRAWENEEPGVSGKVFQAIEDHIPDVLAKGAKKGAEFLKLEQLIESLLKASDCVAEFTTDEDDIKRDGKVVDVSELQNKSLELSDMLASIVIRWAQGIAIAEGATTGAAGPYGVPVDLTFLIPFSLRTIRKIALCYGYRLNGKAGQALVLQILSLAGSNTYADKQKALLVITKISVVLQKTTWKNMAKVAARNPMSKEAMIMSIKSVAKTLGINLTKRKALNAVPIIGALIGAVMNLSFITDVANAAQHTFQKRRLVQEGRYIDSSNGEQLIS